MNHILARIEELPSFAESVRKIIDLFNKGEVDVKNLEQILAQDAGISTQVLRIANSSFFGFGGQINSIKDACMILGLPNVYNLVTAAAILDRFPGEENSIINYNNYWLHSMAVAIATKVIMDKANKRSDSAFLSGLIHDIGKLILDMYFKDEYLKIIQYQKNHQCPMVDAEKSVMNIDHAELGAMLLESWKFPKEIVSITKNHHKLNLEHNLDVSCSLHLANILVKGLSIGDSDGNHITNISPKVLSHLELNWDDLLSLLPDIEKQVKDNEIFH